MPISKRTGQPYDQHRTISVTVDDVTADVFGRVKPHHIFLLFQVPASDGKTLYGVTQSVGFRANQPDLELWDCSCPRYWYNYETDGPACSCKHIDAVVLQLAAERAEMQVEREERQQQKQMERYNLERSGLYDFPDHP